MAVPVLALIAAGQAIYGAVKANKASKQANDLAGQRKAIPTPEELYKIVNATENRASSGYDGQTLNYLTNQTDNAFASSINTAERLGANPNDLSAIFDQKLQGISRIGAGNAAMQLEQFSKYLGALDALGQSKSGEEVSKQNILKDRIQNANADVQAGYQNLQNGINTGIALYAADKQAKLYTEQPQQTAQQKQADYSASLYKPVDISTVPSNNYAAMPSNTTPLQRLLSNSQNYVSANRTNSFAYNQPNWGYIN